MYKFIYSTDKFKLTWKRKVSQRARWKSSMHTELGLDTAGEWMHSRSSQLSLITTHVRQYQHGDRHGTLNVAKWQQFYQETVVYSLFCSLQRHKSVLNAGYVMRPVYFLLSLLV